MRHRGELAAGPPRWRRRARGAGLNPGAGLEIVPSAALKQHAVDVPANPSALETERHRPYPANDLTHTAAGLYPTASDG